MLGAAKALFFKAATAVASLLGQTVENLTFGASSTAGFRLNSNGAAEIFGTTLTSGAWTAADAPTWLLSGVNSDYQSVVTVNSGSLTSGPTAASALSTTRTWTKTRGSTGSSTVAFTVEIQRVSDSSVVASASYTLTAEYTT